MTFFCCCKVQIRLAHRHQNGEIRSQSRHTGGGSATLVDTNQIGNGLMVGGQEDEFCELGDRCHFAHGEDELRKLDTGKHRRRMEREAKGLGEQILFNSLPRWLFCFGLFVRIGLIPPCFFQTDRGKIASDLCLCFSLHPSSTQAK